MTEPLDLDAVGQAELVASGQVTPQELVAAAVARVEARDTRLGAVIHRFDDRAVDQASRVVPGTAPFAGVPFLVKDAVCHTAGDPYHLGMRFLKALDWHEPHDTWLAGRFRRAGFVFVGKTNTPELASSATTEPLAYGPTRNPWDTTRSTGGSSGGAAAAVAAGMVAVAHGNDMGGSIRNPASQCGLVGLKPTRGRTSLGPGFGSYWGPLTHEGVLTRTVRDTAAVLDVVAGNAPGDPYLAPPLPRPLAAEVGADPGVLRVGITTAIPGLGRDAHPECVTAVELAARLLEDLGHHVEADAPSALADHDVLTGPSGALVCVGVARDLARWEQRTGEAIGADDVEPGTWMLADVGRSVTGAQWLALLERLEREARALLSWWEAGHDLLVMPTIGTIPPPLGVLGGPATDPATTLPLVAELTACLSPWNATGQPAVSLPLHRTGEGLPVGVQLVAATGREDVLIRVAAQLEQAHPWVDRRPRSLAR